MRQLLKLTQTAIVILAFISFSNVNASFSDVVADGEGYNPSILNLQKGGIATGFPDGTFRPEQNITRAEFTKILLLSKFSEDEVSGCTNVSFPDVEDDAWYVPYICLAKQKAIISGYDTGDFRPNEPISYAEAAKITVNVLIATTDQGTDDDWWIPFTEILEQRGADPETVDIATDSITRGEMAFMASQIIGEITGVPTVSDLDTAVFDAEGDTELKFLTVNQQEELKDTSVIKHNIVHKANQSFNVSWSDTDFSSEMPTLPENAPIYLLDRPTESTLFALIKDLATALELKGSVVRIDTSHYTVVNIATGSYYLFYDLFHLTFNAEGLALKLASTGIEGADTALRSIGLLGFPYTASEETNDETGDTWIRFTPELALPVVSLATSNNVSGFTPGKMGTLDVKIEDDTITEIRKSFPNVVETSSITIASADELTDRIEAGAFKLGDVQLQYPGALALEDKRAFFEIAAAEKVAISEAKLTGLECGYLIETTESVQSLLVPVCIAHGQGKVSGYSVIFRGVVSIVK